MEDTFCCQQAWTNEQGSKAMKKIRDGLIGLAALSMSVPALAQSTMDTVEGADSYDAATVSEADFSSQSADSNTPDAATDSSAGESGATRSEEHTSELQSLMRNSYAVFCLTKKTTR